MFIVHNAKKSQSWYRGTSIVTGGHCHAWLLHHQEEPHWWWLGVCRQMLKISSLLKFEPRTVTTQS